MGEDMPSWDLVEDAEADVTSLQWWKGNDRSLRKGVPLGTRAAAAQRLCDWLADNGYGEAMADALARRDFAE